MILIGENIHIISKPVREALVSRDEGFIGNLIDVQQGMDYIDLNVGPGKIPGALEWLVEMAAGKKVCLDSTNADEIERALAVVKDPQNCFINSTGKDEPRFSRMTDLALKYGCNLIALTIDDETGIPKTADGRVEIAFEIYEKCMEKGISAEKLYFDPLVLPLNVAQEQAVEVLNTISMLKSCFDPPVNTIIGLSNISNGVPAHLRLVINRAFAMLALDAGLDSAIIDAKDTELVRLIKTPQKPDEDSPIVRALFNKEIYSNSLISTQDSPLGA